MLVAMVIEPIESYCFAGRPKVSMTGGKFEVWCDGPHGIMKPGQVTRDNCEECHCTFLHFNCCGIGYKAGAFMIPGCEIQKLDNCCYQFVKSSNSSIPCTEVECPKPFKP
ncbi:hypothetical protein SNE40_001514 [Patella caerulea]